MLVIYYIAQPCNWHRITIIISSSASSK